MRSKGEGTADYALEALVNVFANVLRNAIMERIEPQIHEVSRFFKSNSRIVN